MPNLVNKALDEFMIEVKKVLGDHLKKIILYGSYARGDYNENSDVDIMLLTDFDFEEIEKYRDEISDIAFEIELKTRIVISPVIKNQEKYNARINIVPFFANVEKEGVVL